MGRGQGPAAKHRPPPTPTLHILLPHTPPPTFLQKEVVEYTIKIYWQFYRLLYEAPAASSEERIRFLRIFVAQPFHLAMH